MNERNRGSISSDLLNFARGFCMGAADSVPGVSGGTIALILGHYHRLVAAISHFDRKTLSLLLSRDYSAVCTRVDLRFLMTLGIGVGVALLSLASVMHWLLENRLPETLAIFMGLMLASIWIVARQIRRWSASAAITLPLGIAIGYAVCSLSPLSVQPGPVYLFFSGVIAITAMILPGISGAFVLVVLGVYHHVTGLIKGVPKGELTLDGLLQLIVFSGGCLVGLAAFTRLLKWLLEHHKNTTFACLLGLMIGSLKRIWPLQQPTSETADLRFSHRIFEFVPISEWPHPFAPLIVLCLLAFVTVLLIETVALRLRKSDSPSDIS
ncbi:MAG: DUF368 domain-containing protein [Pirellulaceae bacterium]